jgi:trans-aconitate 2-methyltransferase
MLAGAAARDDTVRWHQGDIAAWAPERPVDLIFANAALQWVDDHEGLFPRLAGHLAPGGVMAVQMPMAFETRHHTLMRDVATEGPWAGVLRGVPTLAPLLSAETYYDRLAGTCPDIDLWSTTYLHALTGDDAVLNWMSGTALRPYLTALAGVPVLRSAYLEALGEALRRAFPKRSDGVTLLPFPRLFLLARAR